MNKDLLVEIIRSLYHDVYERGKHTWFSYLAPDCVYLGSGVPPIRGASAIRRHFEDVQGKADCIVSESFEARTEADLGYVWGQIQVADEAHRLRVWTRMSCVFRQNDFGRPLIALLHNSYEAIPGDERQAKTLPFPQPSTRIPVRAAYDTYYLDPFQILYIGSRGKSSEVVCLDQTIQCLDSLGQWRDRSISSLYPVHRTFLANTQHIVAVRRYEVELSNGETLPIPEARYRDVRKDLEDLLLPPLK